MKREIMSIHKLSKKNGQYYALNGLSFSLYEGEFLGITGTNCSGISELMDILAGRKAPCAGAVSLDGKPLRLNGEGSLREQGLAVISDKQTLLHNLSVEENVGLSRMIMKKSLLVRKRLFHQITMELFRHYGLTIDPTEKVADLPVYEQTLLEILIACLNGARVIVLYEIIRVFTKYQWRYILAFIDRLRREGYAFILTAYDCRLLKIADRIVILRDGAVGGITYQGEYSFESIRKIVTQTAIGPPALSRLERNTPVVLDARDIRFPGESVRLDFTVHAGEIIGFSTGRQESFYPVTQLFNSEIEYQGELLLDGKPLRLSSRAAAFRKGICCARRYGSVEFCFPNFSAMENLLILKYRDFSRCNVLNRKMCSFAMVEYRDWFPRMEGGWEKPFRTLEPQTQFYLSLNKWLALKPRLLVLDNLFFQADLDMHSSIYEFITQARKAGTAMIFHSTVYSDILELCDVIYEVRQG